MESEVPFTDHFGVVAGFFELFWDGDFFWGDTVVFVFYGGVAGDGVAAAHGVSAGHEGCSGGAADAGSY